MGAGTARALAVSARIVDLLIPRRRPLGRIHSVYARTLNILSTDARFVCLQAGPLMLSPFSVRVDAWPAGCPGILPPGQPVAVRGPRLLCGSFTVSLEDARPWSPELPGHPVPTGPIRESLPTSFLDQLASRAPLDGLAGLLGGPPRSRLERIVLHAGRDLRRAVRNADRDEFFCAATRLLGLGPGLTPSGDDFLIGFLGLGIAAGGLPAAWLASRRRPLLDAAKGLTTALSRAFLDAAFDGAFAEPVGNLLAAWISDAPSEVLAARAEALIDLGHSSGADTLAGIVCAAEALSSIAGAVPGPVAVP